MSDWLWQDETARVGLRLAAGATETDGAERDADDDAVLEVCELWVDGEARVELDEAAAIELSEALSSWARSTPDPVVLADAEVPEGSFFQVYYRHEYTDDGGEVLPLKALGEPADDGAYTLNAESLEELLERAREVGEALAALHERRTGESYGPEVVERARAWISVFRMPDDVRVWKGFWDELDPSELAP